MVAGIVGAGMMLASGPAFAPSVAWGSGETINGANAGSRVSISSLVVSAVGASGGASINNGTFRTSGGKSSGVWYAEAKITQMLNGDRDTFIVGAMDSTIDPSTNGYLGGGTKQVGIYDNSNALGGGGGWTLSGGNLGGQALNDVYMLMLDRDRGEFYAGKNGVWANSGNPSLRTGAVVTGITGTVYLGGSIRPCDTDFETSLGDDLTFNFGATSFVYTPP